MPQGGHSGTHAIAKNTARRQYFFVPRRGAIYAKQTLFWQFLRIRAPFWHMSPLAAQYYQVYNRYSALSSGAPQYVVCYFISMCNLPQSRRFGANIAGRRAVLINRRAMLKTFYNTPAYGGGAA